jgi:hypothetical protein
METKMIALDFDRETSLAAAFYTSYRTVLLMSSPPVRLVDWDDLQSEERRQWSTAAERVITLYRAEGLSLGSPPQRSADDDADRSAEAKRTS